MYHRTMTTTATPIAPAPASARSERKVPTRRVSFEETLRDIPKHFAADGDLLHSHLAASLSAVFPDGEDFFVRSVRHYRSQITDPELKQAVAGFIGQEAVHGREHRVLNDKFAELGYPTKRFEALTKKGLALRTRLAPPAANLAATAALEHFTATLAELLLTNPEARDLFGDEHVRNLFLWHALEESEHKAVAFDVYKAVGGSERLRTMTMSFMTFAFLGGMSVQILISVLGDREAYRRGVLRKSWKKFRKSPLFTKETWELLRDYNRPDFHPDDRDTASLIEVWRTELFGDAGSLTDLLPKAAA